MPVTADRRSRLSSLRLLYAGASPERVRRAVAALGVPPSDAEVESVQRPATAFDRLDADTSCLLCDAELLADLEAFRAAVREVDPTLPILFLGGPDADVPPAVYGDEYADWVFADDGGGDGRRLAHRLRTALRRREHSADEKVRFLEASLDAVEEVFYLFDLDFTLLRWNEAVAEVTGYDDREIERMPAIEFIAPEDRENVLAVLSRVAAEGPQQETASVLTKDGERVPHEFTAVLLRDAGGDPVGICGIGRDISDRRRRERELAELDRVNAVVRDVNRALARASTREEIERAVCDRLAAADPYRFVWVGEYDASTDRIVPTEWTGAEGGYLEEIAIGVDDGTGGGPSVTAYRTGKVAVVQDIASSRSFGPWRSDALDRGYASVAAVPLTYGDATYGVLHVYADRTFAFDDREVDVLTDLGETIGSAIASVERRRALAADTTTELTFRFGDRADFLVNASARTGAALDLRGAVPRSDGGYLAFVDVDGGDPAELRALADDDPTVERVRALTERDDGGLHEFVFREQPVVETLADHSAVVRSLTVEDGDGRVVAAVADRSSVRAVAEAFGRTFADAELLAKRERARLPGERVRTVSEVSLTDRQRASLEAAYRAGFLDDLRRSTGAEIADSLGVSAPTFHSHLRAAQRKLARAFLDPSGEI